jgi:hypothetical protein
VYRHPIYINYINTYCFYITAMVARRHLTVTFYVHCLYCLEYGHTLFLFVACYISMHRFMSHYISIFIPTTSATLSLPLFFVTAIYFSVYITRSCKYFYINVGTIQKNFYYINISTLIFRNYLSYKKGRFVLCNNILI